MPSCLPNGKEEKATPSILKKRKEKECKKGAEEKTPRPVGRGGGKKPHSSKSKGRKRGGKKAGGRKKKGEKTARLSFCPNGREEGKKTVSPLPAQLDGGRKKKGRRGSRKKGKERRAEYFRLTCQEDKGGKAGASSAPLLEKKKRKEGNTKRGKKRRESASTKRF